MEKRPTLFSVFDYKNRHRVTAILIGLNVLVYIVMVISGVNPLSPTSEDLIKWGANFAPYTLGGQWWRLLTCCFLHIGIIHIAVNMYALLNIGLILEPMLGRGRYLLAYLLTGLLSSLSSVVWTTGGASAGASGAIFGIFGVFVALLLAPNFIRMEVRKPLLKSVLISVGLNLVIGFTGIVDNAAHIGGFVSGLAIGFAYVPALKNPYSRRLRLITTLVPLSLTLLISFLVYFNAPNPIGTYTKDMQQIEDRDSIAFNALEKFRNEPKGDKREVYRTQCLQNLELNVRSIKEIDKLDLPDEMHGRNAKLLLYLQIRLSYAQLIIKALDENNPVYDAQIQELRRKMDEASAGLK